MGILFPLAQAMPASSPWWSALYQQVVQGVTQGASALITALGQVGYGLAQLPGQVSPVVTAPALWQPVLYTVVVLVMVVGVVGSVIPALPGITLILGGLVVWGLVVGFAGLKWALGVTLAALVLSVAIDYLAGVLGAQRVGASRWGQIGAFIGMFLGLFGLLPLLPTGIPLLGLLVGTVLGAFVGEFLHRRELKLGQRIKQSGKVGLAIVVGTLVGNILQGILALISVVVFLVTTWPVGS
jgi:uncharacterized protein